VQQSQHHRAVHTLFVPQIDGESGEFSIRSIGDQVFISSSFIQIDVQLVIVQDLCTPLLLGSNRMEIDKC